MRIELVYEQGCPHVEEARRNLRKALVSIAREPVWQEWDRDDAAAPEYASHFASPSILVNGVDLLGEPPDPTGARGCRVYRQPNGLLSGSPPHTEIARLLQAMSISDT